MKTLAVGESGVDFKVVVRLFVKLFDITAARKGGLPAGVNSELLEKGCCGRNEAHSETQPSWFAANFCRLCDLRSREVCLFVLQKIRGTDRC